MDFDDIDVEGCAKIAIRVVVVAIVIVIGSWFGTVIWNWIIPDVFAGAVDQGILPPTITVWQSLKLSIFFWVWSLRSQAANRKD